ncbi:hypothetical protein ROCKSTAR_44 [Mycobacterium phage Rockstar]|uniref:Cell division protein ZapB n=4 Tax=Veracruzvirus TaxID=2948946 RepID=A0A6M3T1T6_9CAUD|nr:hypothetical protein M614_gp42 [Mycobacterium phage BTCU-1]YP_009614561.1 hypothetical protein FDI65_gp42 [Mycobacterium phage Rockstar]QGJ97325.1 hypothetical protein PBI_ISCA_43 [Mycobacterium phage Isca]QJD52019.1 hypothetical protein PBI_MK4_44 [Mycobacterium phage MK4]QJD52178.1 hypothetical protein PBI_JF4_44 [Mycobacterium phage JF4]QJD52258.1 hypothetical protein PBI_JF2_44 [Mycobacterium phage JF2]BBC53762.1 hypothetical protein [Mycobacterium phage B1]
MANVVIDTLAQRVKELNTEVDRLRVGIEHHRRKQWELEVELDQKDRELDQLLDHLIALQNEES